MEDGEVDCRVGEDVGFLMAPKSFLGGGERILEGWGRGGNSNR